MKFVSFLFTYFHLLFTVLTDLCTVLWLDFNLPSRKTVLGLVSYLACVCVELPRPRKRLTELMLKTLRVDDMRQKANKQWGFRFLRSPVKVLSDADGRKVTGIRLVVNKLEVRISEGSTNTHFLF